MVRNIKEEKIHQQETTINIQEKAALIWGTADILRGLYKRMNTEK